MLKENTTMEQKTFGCRFSIIGISMIAGPLFTSCGNNDQIEYKMTVDFVYVNQTDNTIRFSI